MKAISHGNYLIRPFQVHKTQNYIYTFLSSSYSASYVTIDEAKLPPDIYSWQTLTSNPKNEDGIYKLSLYDSVRNLFYSSGSVWNRGESFNDVFKLTGSLIYIINIPQTTFGEEVRPNSLLITAPLYSTESLIDDGNGNITSINNTGSIIGNVFYSLGIAVIKQTTSSFSSSIVTGRGMYLTTGSQVSVQFDATQTIYEHQVLCVMDGGDFNYSTNPSMINKVYDGTHSLSSSTAPSALSLFSSGTLRPYMTTIGAYSSTGELVAIGKFPRAVKRVVDSQQTVVLRFDV